MLCSVCKTREARVFLTQIVADKVQKVDLCEECAKQKGLDEPGSFSPADILLGLGAAEIEQYAGGAELKCRRCGFTQADFKKSGRLGCAECYTTFAEGLEGLLKTMHKGTQHVGKVPQSVQQSPDSTERLKALRKKLEKAVNDEDYELAAGLRDEINQLSMPGKPDRHVT